MKPLHERLREHEAAIAHEAAKGADFGDPKPPICRDLLEAADALLAGPRESGWISCNERMPKGTEKVLACWRDGYQYVVVYMDGEWYNSSKDRLPGGRDITHWQPLPARPATAGSG